MRADEYQPVAGWQTGAHLRHWVWLCTCEAVGPFSWFEK